jgi:exosome complex component RRP40
MVALAENFVLPGEIVHPELLPSHPTLPLKLGPGLRHIPPNTITPTVAGLLCTDSRKNAAWMEFNAGRVRIVGGFLISS